VIVKTNSDEYYMLEYCTSNVHLGLFSCCVGDFHRIHVTYKQVPHMDDSMEGPMKNPMFVGSISKIPMFALFLEKSDFSRVPISKNPMFALCLLKIRFFEGPDIEKSDVCPMSLENPIITSMQRRRDLSKNKLSTTTRQFTTKNNIHHHY
jgi:hypothetical protein